MQVKIVNQSQNPLPEYQTSGSAGMDVMAAENLVILPGDRYAVSTGLFMSIPEGYELQVRSRSGLAFKHGVIVLNSPGTIDSDYRGEVKVILTNTGTENFVVNYGDRIAQLVFAKCEQAELNPVEYLDLTERGLGGFGSTGK